MKRLRAVSSSVWVFLWFCASASAQLGQAWRQVTPHAPWTPRFNHTSVVHGGKLWIIGGSAWDAMGYYYPDSDGDDVWYSRDGAAWTSATLSAPWGRRYSHASVVFGNKIWVLGGDLGRPPWIVNDVWQSSDGVTWSSATLQAPWAPRSSHQAVAFNGRIWVLGGASNYPNWLYRNDVWYSENGTSWTCATPSAPWHGRVGHACVVHNGKMWVLGGSYSDADTHRLSDVWYSSDGRNWTSATLVAASLRYPRDAAASCDGKIWVMGGGALSDVWYSPDGAKWTSATLSAPWTRRSGHTTVADDRGIWLIGGAVGRSLYLNDVWHSDRPFVTAAQSWRLYP